MGSASGTSLRRSIARRWDELAVKRAALVVDRARRGTGDASTHALADQLVGRFRPAAVVPAVTSADLSADEICARFTALYHPTGYNDPPPTPVVRQTIVDQFHRLYYHCKPRPWERTYYRGHRILKLPLDLWVYQTIIDEIRPGLIIETGTRYGGSALWFAHQLDAIGAGRIVTVDIEDLPGRPEHPRITHLIGSSTAQEIVEEVRGHLPTDGSPVLVVLDSDHSRDHVLGELAAYSAMVTPGSYLVVEDTNINGHPAYEDFGPGPFEAVDEFMAQGGDHNFEIDAGRELYYLTQNPRGFLRRK